MIKKAWIILIFVPLIAAGALVLVYAFRYEIKIPQEQKPGETAEFHLRGDFPRKWVASETSGQIRSMETDGSAIYYTSRGAGAIDAATGAKKWETEPQARTPLALGEGLVAYEGVDGNLYAFDATSGAERWKFKSAQSNTLPAAPPEISGGTVYIGEASGAVYALDAATGREKWRLAAAGAVTAIAAEGNTVGILTSTQGTPNSTLISADADTGAVKWKFTQKAEFSSLKIKGNFIYLLKRHFDVQSPSFLTAMDAGSGEVRWEKRAQIYAPVMKIIDGTLYAGRTDEEGAFLQGFDPISGEGRLSVELGIKQAPPKVSAIADGFIYFAGNSELFAADAATGELKWVARMDKPLTTTPRVADDSLCFTYGRANAIYALQVPSR